MGYLEARNIETWALALRRVKRIDLAVQLIPDLLKSMRTGLDYRDFSDSIPADAEALAYCIDTRTEILMFFLESPAFEPLAHNVRYVQEVPTLIVLMNKVKISGECLV